MKVLMVGTPVCPKCKKLAPTIEEICSSRCITYEYKHINELPRDMIDLIRKSGIKSAPLFFIEESEAYIRIVSSDAIFDVLNPPDIINLFPPKEGN